jgi:hypothetical protein
VKGIRIDQIVIHSAQGKLVPGVLVVSQPAIKNCWSGLLHGRKEWTPLAWATRDNLQSQPRREISFLYLYCDITICEVLLKLMVTLFQNGTFKGNP